MKNEISVYSFAMTKDFTRPPYIRHMNVSEYQNLLIKTLTKNRNSDILT